MKVGVLANPRLPRWQVDALANVADLDGVNVEHVVVDASMRDESETMNAGADVVNEGRSVSLADLKLFYRVLREKRLRAFLYADDKLGWLLFGEENQLESLRTTPVESVECLSDVRIEECDPEVDGAWKRLPEDVSARLGENCDVVVRFGFGLLKGDVLETPKYGVLSTHPSDIRKYRGLGPKMTFMRDESTVSVTLQRLSEEIDGGRIVALDSTEVTPPRTIDDLWGAAYDIQAEIYAEGIENLMREDFTPTTADVGEYYSRQLLRTDLRFVAGLLAKNNAARIRKRLQTGRDA